MLSAEPPEQASAGREVGLGARGAGGRGCRVVSMAREAGRGALHPSHCSVQSLGRNGTGTFLLGHPVNPTPIPHRAWGTPRSREGEEWPKVTKEPGSAPLPLGRSSESGHSAGPLGLPLSARGSVPRAEEVGGPWAPLHRE